MDTVELSVLNCTTFSSGELEIILEYITRTNSHILELTISENVAQIKAKAATFISHMWKGI